MTTNIFTAAAQNGSNVLSAVRDLMLRSFHNLNDRRAVRALRGLDDHLLADIGLTRGDIDWALQHSPTSPPSQALNRLAQQRRRRIRRPDR